MTIDERLDRLTKRHEALTEHIEFLTIEVRELAEAQKRTDNFLNIIAALVRSHEHRISRLEGDGDEPPPEAA